MTSTSAVWSTTPPRELASSQAVGIALWVFIGVASTLFSLFLAAYVMRMDGRDWSPIVLPWQAWLSSAVLVAGSVLLELAHRAASSGRGEDAQRWLVAGGGCAIAFLCVQLWSWQALQDARVVWVGNPAASFFYLLTALHGLHVIGGLVGWGVALRTPSPWRTMLIARYWHFLLAVWVVLFASLGWLTPEVVAFICGTSL
jgi:cytochrome c oxidase subunit 3